MSEALAEVAIADTKASILLAALRIGFAAVFGGLLEGDWIRRCCGAWPASGGSARFRPRFVGYRGLLALAAVPEEPAAVRGLLRGHVAGIDSFQDFVPILEASTVTAAHRVQDQLWRVSRVVDRKYTLIRVALLLAAAASVLFFLVGVLEATQANGRF